MVQLKLIFFNIDLIQKVLVKNVAESFSKEFLIKFSLPQAREALVNEGLTSASA
jgi:hypothetical protein